MQKKMTAAIVGSGNIGSDLMMKLLNNESNIDLRYMVGVDPESEGLKRARENGIAASHEGVDWLLQQDPLPDLVFEATSAGAHAANAPRYREAGIRAIDLTPAAVGPFFCPSVNLDELETVDNVNMITCGGQATTPIVAAVSRIVDVEYAEIVASISSKSAGPGTRANVDEFLETTAAALEQLAGAKHAKAIIILNPVEPPMMMRNTVYCALPPEAAAPGELQDQIAASIKEMAAKVQQYVPGYRLTADPQFEEARDDWNGLGRVSVLIEVEGAGDFLPDYAGNLDIITSAAISTANKYAELVSAQKQGA